jgi:hypothetical protein
MLLGPDSLLWCVNSNLLLPMLKQLDELQVIVGFVQAAKRLKTTMKVA